MVGGTRNKGGNGLDIQNMAIIGCNTTNSMNKGEEKNLGNYARLNENNLNLKLDDNFGKRVFGEEISTQKHSSIPSSTKRWSSYCMLMNSMA